MNGSIYLYDITTNFLSTGVKYPVEGGYAHDIQWFNEEGTLFIAVGTNNNSTLLYVYNLNLEIDRFIPLPEFNWPNSIDDIIISENFSFFLVATD